VTTGAPTPSTQPAGWKASRIRISLRTGNDGYRDGISDGLFGIHRRETDRRRWDITHVISGRAVCSADSQTIAKEIVAELESLPIPWSSATEITAEVLDRVTEILKS
jgi:hypothetical protein